MFKLVALLKRRPDMSAAEFKKYYEETHKEAGRAIFTGRAKRYARRYLLPLGPAGGADTEPEFDAICEVWFEDEAAFNEAMALSAAPPLGEYVSADEKKLFDKSRMRLFTVEDERETDLDDRPRFTVEEIHDHLGIRT